MVKLIKYFEQMSLAFAWLAAWLFVLSGIMLSYEVMMRYFFISPTKWAAELSQLCLIYGTLLAMPWMLQNRRHIQINAVTERLGKKIQHLLSLLTLFILMIFSGYVTIYGWLIFYDSYERGRTTGSLLDLPSWIAELSVPVFFFILLIQAIIESWKILVSYSVFKSET
tara:strand:- start:1870 stop:2373 length:504 start_codon:yes stop_codon:yes gene_type:complete